ncbi:unnamed protein product [Cylicocyclus nassatus]|uniref:Uncharacterized protein n=1 Tax=Cylicocyclus nassatus TaxID=53992 RepID=A0AA36H277_CYLNA|nr:unnamed protein product [Cylicocyclus nassatus]
MGQFLSSHGKKESKGTGSPSTVQGKQGPLARPHYDLISKYAELLSRRGYLPEIFLVHETLSSQFIDEDGDVAHEFYAEEKSANGELRRLQRVLNNLRPKGKEQYEIPRLSPDVPVVMWEVEQQC